MRATRIVLAVAGLAALAWGVVLALAVLMRSLPDGASAIAWVVASPVVHDGVVAPVVGVVGLLIARRLGANWRGPVTVGAVVSGVLLLVAVPTLWRTFGGAVNPGLDDRNYAAGLLVWLGAVWLVVLAAGVTRMALARRMSGGAGIEGSTRSTPMAAAPAAPSADNQGGPHTDR